MEYMRGWRALRQDPDWKRKFGIGALLFLSSVFIPFFGQLVVVGWLTLAVRRAVQGQDAPLPDLRFDWDYLMKLVNVGLKPFVARLVWTFPAIIVIVFGSVCAGAGMSFFTLSAAHDGSGPPSRLLPLVLMAVVYLFAFSAMFVAHLFSNVAVMRAQLMGEIAPAIRVREVLATTRVLARELIVGHIVLAIVGTILTFVGLLACYFGVFPAMVLFMVIGSYYNAELYRRYLEKGGQPLAIAPVDVDAPTGAPPQPRAF